MLNLLSWAGMSLQSELCMWTLLGLIRTIFDATLFKVNANLKQVWQMTMPSELSMPVQRALRTMISGVMLVQCFTVYVYLASYIVLLYPIFMEERPTLVLPWLLLAAIRKFLCELLSLSLGLAVCVLVGPARSSCIRFVVFKIAAILPAVYMWLLVLTYYNMLKVAAVFKIYPQVLPSGDVDYGLELAIRRRRTKSLFGEEHLRRKMIADLSGEQKENGPVLDFLDIPEIPLQKEKQSSDEEVKTIAETKTDSNIVNMSTTMSTIIPTDRSITFDAGAGAYEDWCGSEVILPRGSDRILEQFVLMMLRIGAYLKKEGTDPMQLYSTDVNKLPSSGLLLGEDTETPPSVGNNKTRTTSYLQQYPQIFMKKPNETKQLPPNPSKQMENENRPETSTWKDKISKLKKSSNKSIGARKTRDTRALNLAIESENQTDYTSCALSETKYSGSNYDIKSEVRSSKEVFRSANSTTDLGNIKDKRQRQFNNSVNNLKDTLGTSSSDSLKQTIKRLEKIDYCRKKEETNSEFGEPSTSKRNTDDNEATNHDSDESSILHFLDQLNKQKTSSKSTM